ncbi:MAG: VWA domain-containing protein [Chloroflexota bacterium]
MALLAPLALLSVLLVGPLIVAMYLLKLRREERRVSSTFLWRRMVRDVEANAPWQRLRRNWLLLLQLLLMLLLAIALARPFFLTEGIAGRNLIIIVDRSASMGATDAGTTRLEAAKRQARQLVEQLPDGGRATVIAAGGQMEVLAASTTDQRQVNAAIDGIELRPGGGSDLAPALALAAALSSREAESEVAIISDGNVEVPQDLTMPATVRYFPIGERDGNVAISAMALQPSPAGQTLFIQAANYGSAPVTRRMDVYLDGSLFSAYDLSLPGAVPGAAGEKRAGEQAIIVDVPAQVRVAEARLVEDPQGDALPLDDRGWAVGAADERTAVRIVGPGNRFLETALSLLSSLDVTTVPTTTFTFPETAAEVPVTILDGVVPPVLPPGNLLFINPPRSTEYFSVTGQVEFPALRPAPADIGGQASGLLRNVSVSDVSGLRAARITPGAWARVVVEGNGAPMLMAGERDGRRIVVLAFALQNSDLPLQVAFPLLISNIVGYLAPGSGAEASQLQPDQPLVVSVDPTATEVRVTRPDGRVEPVPIQSGQAVYADTSAVGPYIVEQYNGETLIGRRRFAVNLFAPAESNIEPQADLSIPQASGLQQAVTREQVGRQEFWRWLAALALTVLIIEWLVYQRNGIDFLRDRLRRQWGGGRQQGPGAGSLRRS